jgi:hypothetical protein
MSAEGATGQGLVFRVLDALDAPHSGRILQLRLQSGEAPSVKSRRSAGLRATGPDGEICRLRVMGFALFSGKPSDDRLARTGRIDVHIEEICGGPTGLRGEVTPSGAASRNASPPRSLQRERSPGGSMLNVSRNQSR